MRGLFVARDADAVRAQPSAPRAPDDLLVDVVEH
jgi:hypothetical protein